MCRQVSQDSGGDLTNSIIGERMLAYCQAKGFGGIVIDFPVLCIPHGDVAAVYKLAQEEYEMETRTFKDIGKGDNNRAKVEQTLRGLGCDFES